MSQQPRQPDGAGHCGGGGAGRTELVLLLHRERPVQELALEMEGVASMGDLQEAVADASSWWDASWESQQQLLAQMRGLLPQQAT